MDCACLIEVRFPSEGSIATSDLHHSSDREAVGSGTATTWKVISEAFDSLAIGPANGTSGGAGINLGKN